MGFVDGGDYLGYKFEENNPTDKEGREVRGTVYWTVRADLVSPQRRAEFLKVWNAEGYKIGFLLRAEQTILELVYGDVALRPVEPQDEEARELARTYGVPPGYKWVAWGGNGQREHHLIEPNTFTFSVRMRLAPASAGPQLIRVASRYYKGSFTRSLASAWAIGRGK